MFVCWRVFFYHTAWMETTTNTLHLPSSSAIDVTCGDGVTRVCVCVFAWGDFCNVFVYFSSLLSTLCMFLFFPFSGPSAVSASKTYNSARVLQLSYLFVAVIYFSLSLSIFSSLCVILLSFAFARFKV